MCDIQSKIEKLCETFSIYRRKSHPVLCAHIYSMCVKCLTGNNCLPTPLSHGCSETVKRMCGQTEEKSNCEGEIWAGWFSETYVQCNPTHVGRGKWQSKALSPRHASDSMNSLFCSFGRIDILLFQLSTFFFCTKELVGDENTNKQTRKNNRKKEYSGCYKIHNWYTHRA